MDWSNNEIIRTQDWHAKRWQSRSLTQYSELPALATANELDKLLHDTTAALKHDQTTTVQKVQFGDEPFIVKRYNARDSWHRFTRAVRASRAHRCWCMSYHFQRAGLNVAEPLMMIERRLGPLRRSAYLVTKYLDGQELLQLLPDMPAAERLSVKSAVSEAFETMQLHKITHGDMKASNLLWVDEKLFFVDLDAASKHRSSLNWRRAHDKDRRRFLKNWQAYPELLEMFSS